MKKVLFILFFFVGINCIFAEKIYENISRELKDKVKRDENTLEITTSMGRKLQYTNGKSMWPGQTWKAETNYYFIKYLRGVEHFVVLESDFMGQASSMILINDETGKEREIRKVIKIPEVLPDKTGIVIVQGSEVDGEFNGIQIWMFSGKELEKVYEYVPPEDSYELYSFIGFDGNEKIKLNKEYKKGKKYITDEVVLSFSNNKWGFEGDEVVEKEE